jgi:RNA polymerase sigma-70 factor, ECF subfamily
MPTKSNVVAITMRQSSNQLESDSMVKDSHIKEAKVTPIQTEADPWVKQITAVARKQDKRAYQQLFEYFAPRLKTFFIQLKHTPEESEELIQETFINVWRKADLFVENKAKVSTWIYTIARNKRLDYLRKLQRQVNTTDLGDYDPSEVDGLQFESRSEQELVRIIAQIPQEQQVVLKKVYFEGYSHQAAAEVLDITLGTVKGRVRSGLNHIKRIIGGDL